VGGLDQPHLAPWTANSIQTATVTNTGTIAFTQLSYQFAVTFDASKDTPVLTLAVCPNQWSAGTCNGGNGTNIPAVGSYDVNGTTAETSTVVPPWAAASTQATSSGTFHQWKPLEMASSR
jgi:hypothetical protein